MGRLHFAVGPFVVLGYRISDIGYRISDIGYRTWDVRRGMLEGRLARCGPTASAVDQDLIILYV